MSKFLLGAMLLTLLTPACAARSSCGDSAISEQCAIQMGVQRGLAELQSAYPGQEMVQTGAEIAWKPAKFLSGPDHWRVLTIAQQGGSEFLSFVDVAACGGEIIDFGTIRDTV